MLPVSDFSYDLTTSYTVCRCTDLVFWYSLGPGSPVSAALGKGWVEEMISRLEKNRITNSSSAINQTIISNNITFPLDQPIYVDATHDSVLSSSTF